MCGSSRPPTCRSTRYLETDHFRKDLFYRISGITLRLPRCGSGPTTSAPHGRRDRHGERGAQGKPIVGLSRAAADRLLSYDWPGNLRELKRVIHTAVAITEGDVISPEAILLETSVEAVASETERVTASHPAQPLSSGPPPSADLTLRNAELRHIQSVLVQMKGNKRRAAKALGLSRSTLDRKLGGGGAEQ